MEYIVVYGNPAEGFDFRGPFKLFADAEEWARSVDGIEYNCDNGDNWYIAILKPI